jgi:hypothetical protein
MSTQSERTAESLIAFEKELQPLYRAKRDNPTLSARVFRLDAREAEKRRKLETRIRGERK